MSWINQHPSAAVAQRVRRHRERQRRGLRCASVELTEREIAYLCQKRLLTADQAHDRNALTRALRTFLNRAFSRARERERVGVFEVTLEEEHIDRLVAMRFLYNSERRDPDAVMRAFAELVERAILANHLA